MRRCVYRRRGRIDPWTVRAMIGGAIGVVSLAWWAWEGPKASQVVAEFRPYYDRVREHLVAAVELASRKHSEDENSFEVFRPDAPLDPPISMDPETGNIQAVLADTLLDPMSNLMDELVIGRTDLGHVFYKMSSSDTQLDNMGDGRALRERLTRAQSIRYALLHFYSELESATLTVTDSDGNVTAVDGGRAEAYGLLIDLENGALLAILHAEADLEESDFGEQLIGQPFNGVHGDCGRWLRSRLEEQFAAELTSFNP